MAELTIKKAAEIERERKERERKRQVRELQKELESRIMAALKVEYTDGPAEQARARKSEAKAIVEEIRRLNGDD